MKKSKKRKIKPKSWAANICKSYLRAAGEAPVRSFPSLREAKGENGASNFIFSLFSLHALTRFTLVANGEEKEKQNTSFHINNGGLQPKKKRNQTSQKEGSVLHRLVEVILLFSHLRGAGEAGKIFCGLMLADCKQQKSG